MSSKCHYTQLAAASGTNGHEDENLGKSNIGYTSLKKHLTQLLLHLAYQRHEQMDRSPFCLSSRQYSQERCLCTECHLVPMAWHGLLLYRNLNTRLEEHLAHTLSMDSSSTRKRQFCR